MRPDELHDVFTGHLPDERRAAPRLTDAWRAFCRLAAIPIEGLEPEDDEDRLLFEAGVDEGIGPAGRPAYMVGYGRQLSLTDSSGVYAGMLHLTCTAIVDVDAAPGEMPELQFWGLPGPRSSEWVSRAETAPAFAALLRDQMDCSVDVSAGSTEARA